VAESLAINPNTVLKADRELEHDGLVEGRPAWAPSCSARWPARPWAARSSSVASRPLLAVPGHRDGLFVALALVLVLLAVRLVRRRLA
jgi:hypothetical protein